MIGEELEVHPAANIFPLLEGAAFEALMEDIVRCGQSVPIEIWEGKVIDGRNRLRACRLAGVEPKVRELTHLPGGSPLAYVVSVNLQRRHLQPSQLAMVAARVRHCFDEDAARRRLRRPSSVPEPFPEQKGDARDRAGAVFGISGKTVDCATRVLRRGVPELISACDQGEISVSRAAKLACLSAERQNAALSGGKRAIANALGNRRDARSNSHELWRLLRKATRIERVIRQEYGGIEKLFRSGDFDADAVDDFTEQITAIAADFNELAADAYEFVTLRDQEDGRG